MYRMSVIDNGNKELTGSVNGVLNTLYVEDVQMQEKAKMIKQIEDALPIVQEQFLKELLFGQYKEKQEIVQRAEFLKLNLRSGKSFCTLALEIDEFMKSSKYISISDKYLLSYSVKLLINALSSSRQKLYAVENSDNSFIVLIIQNQNTDLNKNLFMKTITAICNVLNKKLGFNSTIGVSEKTSDILELPVLYHQSLQALQTKLCKHGNIILYSDIEGKGGKEFAEKVNLESIYKIVKNLLLSGSAVEFDSFLNTFFASDKGFQTQALFKSIMIANIMEISLLEKGKSYKDVFDDEVVSYKKLSSLETINEVKQYLYIIFIALKTYFSNGEKSRDEKIADDIKSIIKERYNEQLTVNDIVENIYLSPSQANNIFKKQVGKTIFDYLTEFRIEKAKELLKDPYSKIYLVADSVGYVNKSHFCMLFIKHTGVTPSEYKKLGCPAM